jgi:hypothetical protein
MGGELRLLAFFFVDVSLDPQAHAHAEQAASFCLHGAAASEQYDEQQQRDVLHLNSSV